jgi:ABC-type bacteriocin/lantibiotic exporter with double-glycine peptidase domain
MIIKNIVDFVYNFIKDVEEVLSADSVVLKMKRSVQLDSYSCGAQSVYMILSYYDKDKTLNEIKESLNTTESDGTDTKQILNYLVDNKLEVQINEKGAISSIQNAIDNGYPVLITVDDGDHWVVVYGYSNDGIFVVDSSRSRFLNQWGYGEFIKRWDENWIAVIKGNVI